MQIWEKGPQSEIDGRGHSTSDHAHENLPGVSGYLILKKVVFTCGLMFLTQKSMDTFIILQILTLFSVKFSTLNNYV